MVCTWPRPLIYCVGLLILIVISVGLRDPWKTSKITVGCIWVDHWSLITKIVSSPLILSLSFSPFLFPACHEMRSFLPPDPSTMVRNATSITVNQNQGFPSVTHVSIHPSHRKPADALYLSTVSLEATISKPMMCNWHLCVLCLALMLTCLSRLLLL